MGEDVFRVRIRVSGQDTHFNISDRSRRMWLNITFDSFAILALGGHQTVVELQAEPEAGRARVLRKVEWVGFFYGVFASPSFFRRFFPKA